MFPLSDESENLALGWLDTYLWSEFEDEIVPELKQAIPRLILIKEGGKNYTMYEGDIYDLDSIRTFVNTTHKS